MCIRDRAKDVADGVVITADTLEDLAEKLGIDAAGLVRTMKDWNEDVAAGKDPFGRKDGLEPISGPFYAYKNTAYNSVSYTHLLTGILFEKRDVIGMRRLRSKRKPQP